MLRPRNSVLLFALIASASWAYAQNGPAAIRWKAEAQGIVPRAAQAETPAEVLDASEGRHVVLQFKSVPGQGQKKALEAKGVSLLRYLGENSWFAHVKNARQAKEATGKAGLHAAMRIKREWKLEPRLARGEIPPFARIPAKLAAEAEERKGPEAAAQDRLALYVIFHADVDLDKAGMDAVAAHDGTVQDVMRSINGAVIWLPADRLHAFGDEDVVEWLELPLPPLDVTNDGSRLATQANQMGGHPYYLDGTGVGVLVYDGGTALAEHGDLQYRAFVRDDSGTSPHATHVAGTIAGNGAASGGLYAGMAPAVTVQSFGFEYNGTGQFLYTNPGDLETDYSKSINNFGTVIANNSIGTNISVNGYPCEWEGDYGATCMLIDSIVCGSLGVPTRIVWAAGNERGSGRCGVDYRTIPPPAGAKNHISVGAVNSNDLSMTNFSSWGPTDDGRTKPDVVAPGCQVGGDNGISSTTLNGGYNVLCGTSMAAPAVTGVSALILQDWSNLYPGEPLPPNSMLKALLIHNAYDLGNPGPDYRFGYGAVRVADTIQFLRSGNLLQDSISEAQENQYFVSVTEAYPPVKVTLAWDDPPGAINTIPELVNDLDLKIISPSGQTYYPWTLDPGNPGAPAKRNKADHINNVEQVLVDVFEPGVWTVVVKGHSVPDGPQEFSLTAGPDLRTCSSAGYVSFKSAEYGCSSAITVEVNDCDLDVDPSTIQSVVVTVASSSEPAGETVLLTETSASSATFIGAIQASTTDGPDVLLVSHQDALSTTYIDADDGLGNFDVVRTATSAVDCQAPSIGSLTVTGVTSNSASIAITTNEPTRVRINYGTSCGATTLLVAFPSYLTQHNITLKELTNDTLYYFNVEAEDRAGNMTVLDNGGACFTFRTSQRQSFFTQMFSPSGFDLDYRMLTLTPTETLNRYTACLDAITALPVSEEGASQLYLLDDAYVTVYLADGKQFPFYDNNYSQFHVGSNGYVTFDSGDSDYTESIADHFSRVRISVLFDDLMPSGGQVWWRQLEDRAVITWDKVPEYNSASTNTFQLVIHFDGTIQLVWAGIAALDGLVGLSPGTGEPHDFQQDDLSATIICIGPPAKAFDPWPTNGASQLAGVNLLGWQKGSRTTFHEVYLGEDPLGLILRSTQAESGFVPPVLWPNRTYYWRIDEVNGYGRTVGDVWSFTTTAPKGDFDEDGDLDISDYGYLQACLSGIDIPQTLPDCQNARLDGDSDVDVEDINLFLQCMTGPGQAPIPNCIP